MFIRNRVNNLLMKFNLGVKETNYFDSNLQSTPKVTQSIVPEQKDQML